MNPSSALAHWLLDELAARGVTRVVVAPGSRNAPLSMALTGWDFDVHVRVDERTAAFLALGMAKSSRRPVAVITTSGTAAANLHPAVLEAAHAGVPLIAVTADRPSSLARYRRQPDHRPDSPLRHRGRLRRSPRTRRRPPRLRLAHRRPDPPQPPVHRTLVPDLAAPKRDSPTR